MAQYYQILGQESPIQTVTIDELRQYYPNITCVEPGVEYVINNQDEVQYESRQVLLSTDQSIVLNSAEAPQQIIVEQAQHYGGRTQTQYSVQTVQEDSVADFPVEIHPQIYYTTPPPPQPKAIMQQQTTASPISPQHMITTNSVVAQTQLTPNGQRQMVTQHTVQQQPQVAQQVLMMQQVQRRMQLAQPPVIPTQTPQNIPRPIQTPQQIQSQIPQPNQNIQRPLLQQSQAVQAQTVVRTLQQQQVSAQNTQVVQTVVHRQIQQQQMTIRPNNIQQPVQQQMEANQTPNYSKKKSEVIIADNQGQKFAAKPRKPAAKRASRAKTTPARGRTKKSPASPSTPVQNAPNQIPPKQYQAKSPTVPIQQQQLQQLQMIHQNNMQPQLMPKYIAMQPPRINMQQPQGMLQQAQLQGYQEQQPLIPIPLPSQQPIHNGHSMQSNTYSPPSSQGSNQYVDDSPEEYKDSARMLVCLENGEQRLITFTLPKESCTVQDLLEQVGVPFNAETKIECISNPGSEIDYIVNVGIVQNSHFPVESQQPPARESSSESQESVVSLPPPLPPGPPPLDSIPAMPPPPQIPAELLAEEIPLPQSPEKSPEQPKETPKFVSGHLAICSYCGYLSEDFNRCQRCKTKLRGDVKTKPMETEDDKTKLSPSKASMPVVPPTTTINITLKTTPKPATPANNAKTSTPRTTKKKAKIPDAEPVVLTLSSDEEGEIKGSGTEQQMSKILENSITIAANRKEPVISQYDNPEVGEEDLIERVKASDFLKGTPTSTILPCRTVRIGSYRFVPKEEVQITSLGLKIFVPAIADISQTFKCFIPMKYIIKVLANFSKGLPVLFFYVTPSIGHYIRNELKMEENSALFFDPLSHDEPCKRITLLPEVIDEDAKAKIKKIFISGKTYNMLEELSPKEANDILIRTCPRDVNAVRIANLPPTTSFVDSRELVIYPQGKGGIAINTQDYLCLAQDEFLNDVIIDFYLKYLVLEQIPKSFKDRVHVLSSFFYKRLTTKPFKATRRSNPYETDSNLTAAEKRHLRVKNWTKNVNIFDKDFIIIPINENSHWFLAIICFPGLEGWRSMNDRNKIIKETVKPKKRKTNTITVGNTTITTIKSEKAPIEKIEGDCDVDRDEAEGDESELEESEAESEDSIAERIANDQEPIMQPCILIFDSLAGAARYKVVATLRDYLTYEHRTKLKSTKTFCKDNIRGHNLKVPQQTNFTDCGLYVLQYTEAFFMDPIKNYRIPIKQLNNWFEEIVVTRKREDISNLIKQLMVKNKKDPSILPDILFPTLNGQLVPRTVHPPSDCEDEEEEEDEEEHLAHLKMEEEMDDEEDGEEEELGGDTSLSQLQHYHSDSSEEFPRNNKSTRTSPILSSGTSSFVVSSVSNLVRPDVSNHNQSHKKSNQDTMSYLKSKRIVRHRSNDTEINKKQKLD